MALQYISFVQKDYSNFVCSTFDDFELIDKFDYTIIDFSENEIWESDIVDDTKLGIEKNLEKLNETISNSSSKKVIFLFPQDISWSRINRYGASINISKRRTQFRNILIRRCFLHNTVGIGAVTNETSLNNITTKSDFFFQDIIHYYEPLTVSKYSNHPTTIRSFFCGIIFTFLSLATETNLIDFLETIGIAVPHSNMPKWLEDYHWYNDDNLYNTIQKNKIEIEALNKENKECSEKIKNNEFYKTILISQGDELVNTILKIFEEIFEIDASTFVDKKIQDFDMTISDVTILFEIKGISTNVKNQNITQLDLHESRFIDELNDKKCPIPANIRKVLIINHQRDKKISERESINDQQIRLAEKKGVLIIETFTLLTLLERFRKNEITKDIISNYFINSIGLLKV